MAEVSMLNFPSCPPINISSTLHAVNSNRAELKCRFGPNIRLDPNRRHYLKLVYGKIPLTKYNISAALGNNKIRYTLDNTAVPIVWHEVTFYDGIYTDIDSTKASVNTALEGLLTRLGLNTGYTVDALTGAYVFPFSLAADSSASKGIIAINPSFANNTKITVDLSNNGTSNLYLLMGFTALEAVLDGSVSLLQSSTNNLDVYDGAFAIQCDIVTSYVAGAGFRDQLMAGTFTGTANGYFFMPNEVRRDIIVPIRQGLVEIDEINMRIVDRNGRLIVFGDNSTDSDVSFELYLY